ncbi:MAG: hypothetical protein JSW09_01185, partial [Pseudomonadota bacterium]
PGQRETADVYRELIQRKLAAYNAAFPEIHFVHFEGGELWHGEMVALKAFLGTESAPLDYEHPPHLRPELMEATLARLVHVLRQNVISATAFRLPADNATGRGNLCVVTLNRQHAAASDFETTRDMFGLEKAVAGKISHARYLNTVDYVEFAVDHEVFHCLASVYVGGAPIVRKEFGAEYNQYRRESASDAFALAMHIRAHGAITPYARNITHVRALGLLSNRPDHCTFKTTREILKIKPETLAAMSPRDLMAFARQTAERWIDSYDAYVDWRIAALQAARIVGLASFSDADLRRETEQRPAAKEQVELLVKRYRYYYEQLFTDTELSFDILP